MNMAVPFLATRQDIRTGFGSFFDRLFDWLMYVFLFITIFLPSGSIYGLNIKFPLYLVLLPLAVFIMFWRGYATRQRLALLLGVPIILSAWIVIGVTHGVPIGGVLRQYTDILLVLIVCWLVQVFCTDNDLRRVGFLRVVLNAEVATSVLKVGLIVYAVVRGIPTIELVVKLSAIFGVGFITMDLGAMVGRIQFVSDAVIPACVFIVLRFRNLLRIGNLRASFTVLLLLTSVIFSFSRYLWAFTALAFFLGLLTGKRDRFQLVVTGLLVLSVFASLPALTSLYELRFSTDVAGSSDLIRTEQTAALQDFFKDASLFGHGLGSYTNRVIRTQGTDNGIRYSYEAQLLALAGQIGMTGMSFLLLVAARYYSDLWWRPQSSIRDRVAIVVLLGFWLSAGIFNPLLFHPIAGINYAAFAILAALTGSKRQQTSDFAQLPLART